VVTLLLCVAAAVGGAYLLEGIASGVR
jgi:hypothetical protein